MKKIMIIPDSFKGAMESALAGEIIATAAEKCGFEPAVYPVADGGEGTVDAFAAALGGEREYFETNDLYFNDISACAGILKAKEEGGVTGVIEAASCVGVKFRALSHNIENTTTYGIGRLIEGLLDYGAERIILGLGGSLTNDGGCGMAAALGVRFYNKDNELFIPVSGTLSEIASIDVSAADKRLKKTKLTVMCDVNIPLHGENGAAYIFSPQKGAFDAQVKALDDGLKNLAYVSEKCLGAESDGRGDGAAGGAGFGARVFLGAEMKMGIDVLLDEMNFAEKAKECSLIVTGEGRFDSQTLKGKAVSGIAKRAKEAGIPVIVIAGDVKGETDDIYKSGVSAAFSTNRLGLPFEQAKLRCEKDLYDTAYNIFNLLSVMKKQNGR